jgi:hypothetical protein
VNVDGREADTIALLAMSHPALGGRDAALAQVCARACVLFRWCVVVMRALAQVRRTRAERGLSRPSAAWASSDSAPKRQTAAQSYELAQQQRSAAVARQRVEQARERAAIDEIRHVLPGGACVRARYARNQSLT